MLKAIVYKSCTGFTKQYAELLKDETGLALFSLDEAKSSCEPGSEIIFLGWLNAGKVMGLREAQTKFSIRAVCGVGMAETGAQILDIKKRNVFPEDAAVFTLQGGFDMQKLPGIYRMMMKTMKATYGKKLASKQDKTPEEADMLDMLTNGGTRVSRDNLKGIVEWYNFQK